MPYGADSATPTPRRRIVEARMIMEAHRFSALVGLAKRHDTHILGHLINELEQMTITDRVVEAAYTLLGFDKDQEEWSRQDYARALRERFSGVAPQGS